jgi:hypothetical protein
VEHVHWLPQILYNDPFFYEQEPCPSNRQTGCESRTGCQFPPQALK